MSEVSESGTTESAMDIHQILGYLPHRYPMLLVDRVLDVLPGVRIRALKNVTINEPFFPGHYPHHPVMPGVLVVEAMAPTAAILAFKTMGSRPDDKSVYYFVGIDNARFKKPVGPGDQLLIDVTLGANKRGMWKFSAAASVAGQVVAVADLICAVRPTPAPLTPSTSSVMEEGGFESR